MLPLYKSDLSVYNYDEIPPGYYYKAMVGGAKPQQYWHKKKFSHIAGKITPSDEVLDLGCGPGSFIDILGESGNFKSAIGADISSNQIDFAIENIKPKFAGSVDFIRLSETERKLPFDSNSFDVVSMIEVIEHVHPYIVIEIMSEIRRVLRPNGRLLLTTPNYRSLWPLIEFLLNKKAEVKYHDQHINKYTPNSLIKFVETGGFSIKEYETFFVLSPFVSWVNWKLAEFAQSVERVLFPTLGNLISVDARINSSLD